MRTGIRAQRIIAFLLLLSPWIYVPNVFKELAFIFIGIALYLSTLDIRKKKPTIERTAPQYQMTPVPPVMATERKEDTV